MTRVRTFAAGLLLAAAFALGASRAGAAPGVNLYVNDCGAGTRASSDVTNDCFSNVGTAFALVGSVVLPAMSKPQFSGCQSLLDIQVDTNGAISDWWRADACRSDAFIKTADPIGIGGTCPTIWDSAPAAGTTLTVVVADGAPASRIRLLIDSPLDAGVAAATTLTGDGTSERSVFGLTVTRIHTTGAGSCAGCYTAACLVLNEINFRSLTDGPADWLRMTDPAVSRHVAYNGAMTTAICPGSVPVRNRTWGAMKALYR